MRSGSRRTVRLAAIPAVALVLLLLPGPIAGTPAPAAPRGDPAMGHDVVSAGIVPAVADVPPVPAAASPPRAATPSADPPAFEWATAQIFYGPGDPESLLFGEGSAMVADDRLQNTTTFGGLATGGLSNITLVYNNGTLGYWWYATGNGSPSARANASFASDDARDEAVLFGGLTALPVRTVAQDTWVYSVVNESWTNVSGATAPPARENAAFAIDEDAGVGLLVGGIDPSYSAGGSSGTVLWNDSWILNLSTDQWSPLSVTGGPGPLYGSGLVFDPTLGAFLLFGGCDESHCVNTVWSYVPGSTHWSRLSPGGTAPGGRGSASWVWDPADNVTLLYGGFQPGPDGPVPLGDTFLLDANATDWSTVPGLDGPPPLFGAASAFSDYPGCVGMWVQGGSPATEGIVYNVSLLQSLSAPERNCFGPYGGGTNNPPPPCANATAQLSVKVVDALSGAPLAGADVGMSGSCGTSHGVTDIDGLVNLSEPAPDLVTVSVSRPGYHSAQLAVTFTGAIGETTFVALDPDPSLHARVLGVGPDGTAPLANASVVLDHGIVLGVSDADGWMNATDLPAGPGATEIEADRPGFSEGTATVTVPYTGVVFANLTLYQYGPLDVEVRDALSGRGLAGAMLTVSYVEPIGANVTNVLTSAAGWWNSTGLAGNYSLSAITPGYYRNGTAAPVYHGWVDPTVAVVNLTPIYGADVSVHVRDNVTGAGIPNATVAFGAIVTLSSGPGGWANATNLEPAGLLRIDARATGYYPNATTVTIGPYVTLPDVELRLQPAPPCTLGAPCPASNSTGGGTPFSLLPPPGPWRTALLAGPLILLAATALLLLWPGRTGALPRSGAAAGRPLPGRGL